MALRSALAKGFGRIEKIGETTYALRPSANSQLIPVYPAEAFIALHPFLI
jgi:hypothetical protein